MKAFKEGINDIPLFRVQYPREYHLWNSMLRRCYSEKELAKCPTYRGCQVCEKWQVLSGFIEDLPLIEGYELWKNNPNQYISIDKDIKGNRSKLYSLENCKFVTKVENSRECAVRTDLSRARKISIDILDSKGRYCVTVSGAEEVAEFCHCNRDYVYKVLAGKHPTCKGYILRRYVK